MQISANTFGQRVTLNKKNAALESVLKEIRLQSGYNFIYNANLIEKAETVTIRIADATVEEALAEILKEGNLTFEIKDKTIILDIRQTSLWDRIVDHFIAIDVSGTIVNEIGQPLSGATVRVKSTGEKTTTDKKGYFFLKDQQDDAILVISYIGYVTQEVNVRQDMTIKMEVADKSLSEVVINKGYYSETQELATGNAVTINAQDIEKQPVINPLLAIQGRVAGLQITQTSGITNGPQNVLIRGRSSINSLIGNDPLYVVDGVPYQSRLLNDAGGNNGGNGTINNTPQGSPLNYINPNDIASITVLKDADASAIYGSRGGNGVILITTKKGRPGEMTLGANFTHGIMPAPKPLELLNTQQYLDMRREAFKNDGLSVPDISNSPTDPNYDVNGTWSQTSYTDWQKELIGNSAYYTNLNLSLSGGSEQFQYALRSNYNRQGNLYPGDFDDKRGSLSFYMTTFSKNKKFSIDFIGNLLRDNNQNAQNDLTAQTLRAPNAPASFKADGTLDYGTAPYYTNANNPYAYTLRTYGNKTDNITISLKPSYKIVKGMTATANIGYTDLTNDIKIAQPTASYSPSYVAAVGAASLYTLLTTYNKQRTWIAEPQLSYTFKLNDFKFDALAGTSFQQSLNDGHTYIGRSFISDVVIGNIANASIFAVLDNGTSQYNYNAVYGRFNANLEDKYILNLTGRRDGSSRFGPGHQFGNFYSAAGAWLFFKEAIIEKAFPFLSFGKLRASYGTSGNDNIGNYAYYDLYRSTGENLYQGMIGFAPSNLANPNVGWEKNAKLEFAMDLGFFKDRIFATAAYYRNLSSNQLLSYTIPDFTGFSSIPNYNFPALVQNYGLEFTFDTRNIESKSFQWSSSFNISFNRNKLLKFDGIENTSYSTLYAVGEPIIGRVASWVYAGIDPQTGLYTALKNDGTVGSDVSSSVNLVSEYQVKINNMVAKYFGGFSNTLKYKKLQLDVFLQFVKQTGRLSLAAEVPGFFARSLSEQVAYTPSNIPVEFLDRWQKPGDQSKYQRFTQSSQGRRAYNAWSQSDATFVDASFIRGKNVMLSYQLPAALQDKLKLKNVVINLSGQNLFTITPYKGRDPETQSYTILPPQKVFVLGLQANL